MWRGVIILLEKAESEMRTVFIFKWSKPSCECMVLGYGDMYCIFMSALKEIGQGLQMIL